MNQSKVSRTFPSRIFLVNASFGKNVLVLENTTLQQHFTKENHGGIKFRAFLIKPPQKKFPKMLQQQINFGQTALHQTQIRQLSGHRSTKIFIPICSYIYAD